MKEKKRHHFLSRFYLKHFTKDKKIWTYDTTNNSCRPSTVFSAAFEKYLYSAFLDDGSRNSDMEEAISGIENKAAPLYKKLLNGEKIVGQERADIASFFAITYVKTDSFRRNYAQIVLGSMQSLSYATASNDKAYENYIKEYEKEMGPMSDKDKRLLREGLLNPGDYELTIDKGWTLQAMGLHDKLAPLFFDMEWNIFSVPRGTFLITGDTPLIKVIPVNKRHPFLGGGFLDKHVEVSFPLSPEKCWLGHWVKGLPNNLAMPIEMIKDLNRLRANYSERFLFADRYSEGIKKLGQKFKDKGANVKISGGPSEHSKVSLHRSNK